MTKLITNSELEDLIEQARQNGEEIECKEDSGSRFTLPQRVGRGGRQFIQLRDGVYITVDDAEFWQPLCVQSYLAEPQQLFLGFYLSSSFRIINPGLKAEADRLERRGENCLSFMQDIQNIEYFPAQQRIQRIAVGVGLDVLRSFRSGWEALPTPVQRLVEGKEIESFHQTLGTITPAMQQALQQILQCPYQGAMRQIYLEGKVLELLALQLRQWVRDEQNLSRTATLRPDDIERLYLVRDTLTQSLDDYNPPSLLELARQVGLNEHKLKWGFRQIFGTTVFGYLRDYQMQQAQRLLTEEQMSVTEVAHAVGYASVPSFSAAFRKQLGVSPRAYRNGQRG